MDYHGDSSSDDYARQRNRHRRSNRSRSRSRSVSPVGDLIAQNSNIGPPNPQMPIPDLTELLRGPDLCAPVPGPPQSDIVNNITISRDTTSASTFQREKLMALQEPHIAPGPCVAPTMPHVPPMPVSQYPMSKKAGKHGSRPPPGYGNVPPPGLGNAPPPMSNLAHTGMPPPHPSSLGHPHNPFPPMPPGSRANPHAGGNPPVELVQTGEMQKLMAKIRALENENDELMKAQGIARKPPRYQVFHRIDGNNMLYLEPPIWEMRGDDEFKLKCELPITSVSRYLQRHRDVAFYIEKLYTSDTMEEEEAKAVRQGADLPEPKIEMETIHLETDEMLDAVEEFEDLHANFKDQFPNFKWTSMLSAPFLWWYRFRSETNLSELSPRHQELMKLLTTWIDDNYLTKYSHAKDLFDSGFVSKETMPYFVAPGDVIVRKEGNEKHSGYMAQSWLNEQPKPASASKKWEEIKTQADAPAPPPTTYACLAWSYGYDGTFYKAVQFIDFEIRVNKDDEKVSIGELTSFPLRYASEAIKAKLQKRGKTFWECRQKRLVAYQDHDDEAMLGTGDRYMIDFLTYKQLHPDTFQVVDRSYIPHMLMGIDETPEGPHANLFPMKIVGYNLRKKAWVDMEVDRIVDVVWNKQAFEHLVIEPGTKTLVQALVTTQISPEKSTDMIANKGNGLILLLHGGPGTGKTMTAESLAEYKEMPLYRVSCGDIGTQAESVEKYLESVLHLGKIWGCVVLLDEADVFLEQRTLNDLQRNALVSVFLRVLEYSSSFIILTSNRVQTFDEAFASRIQLALHYESLTRDQRYQIWANFFSRLKSLGEQNIDYVDVEGYLNILADNVMNGRQIRNAITTARQLALFQGESLAYAHLKHVIGVANKFDKHLNAGTGSADENGSIPDAETNHSKYTWADWKKLNIDPPIAEEDKP